MNSLRFGDIRPGKPNSATNRRLLSGVVSGIAHYGNCIGVPTVGGEIYFDASYDGNPLVNVFCLGTLRTTDIRRGAATGLGNPVFYVGNRTGRDGLAGAAFASRDLTEASKEDRPAVQVGDPFIEKLCSRRASNCSSTRRPSSACRTWARPGLTCSTCETASRGGQRHRDRPGARAATRARHDALRDHALGIAGANADHRPRKGHEETVTENF